MDESVPNLSVIHLPGVSPNTPGLVYSLWEQVHLKTALLPLAIIPATARVSGRKQQNHVNEQCSASSEKNLKPSCVCSSTAQTRVKTTSSPCDAQRWPDKAITSHRELLWVTRSESQSAAETAVSQKQVTNRFGLLIMKEEVGINGFSNVRIELEVVSMGGAAVRLDEEQITVFL